MIFMRTGIVRSLTCLLTGPLFILASPPKSQNFDFEGTRVEQAVRKEIEFTNSSPTDSLSLLEIHSSCPCLRVLSHDKEVPPGGSGKITVEYKPTKEGKAAVELRISILGAKPGILSFEWKGVILPGQNDAETGARDAFLITAESVHDLLKRQAVTVVDVRPPDRFEECHITGALNMSVAFLLTTPFAKGKNLVLSGLGHDDFEILRQAKALASVHPPIKVLSSGVRRWQQLGYPVEGSASKTHLPWVVNANEFLPAKAGEWVLLTGKKFDAKSLQAFTSLGLENHLLTEFTHEVVMRTITTTANTRAGAMKVVIASEFGQDYAAIENGHAQTDKAPVFYVSGGLSELEHFAKSGSQLQHAQMRTQSSLDAAASQPLQMTRSMRVGCDSCPPSKSSQGAATTIKP